MGKKKVIVRGKIEEMMKVDENWVKEYFRGKSESKIDKYEKSRRRKGKRLKNG